MKRDWKIIQLILEQAEKETLVEYARQGNFPKGVTEDSFLRTLNFLQTQESCAMLM